MLCSAHVPCVSGVLARAYPAVAVTRAIFETQWAVMANSTEPRLEQHELAAHGGLVQVHERGQLAQRHRRVQLQQLLEHGQVPLLVHQAQEAAQLQPVRLLRHKRTMPDLTSICVIARFLHASGELALSGKLFQLSAHDHFFTSPDQ